MMRVVAAPDDAVLADEGCQGGQRALVDLEADGALPGEVLRRPQRHVGAEAAEGLRLLVQAFEPERGPTSGGLQEEEAQSRVALQRAECDELGAGEHGLEGMGHRVQEERVERAVRSERRHDDRAALVDADGHAELLGRIPHHVVGAVGQRAAQAGVGADESGHEAELGDGAPELACRRRRVLQREHGRSEEPAGIGGAVLRQPVVVGGGEGDRRRRVLHHREVQPDGRVQHGLVDALAVHVVQAGHRVRSARLGVGQGAERGGVVERGARTGERAERHGQDLGVADDHVFVPRTVGGDARPVALGQGGPGRLGLDDMAVGVDDGAGARWERKLCRALSRRRGAPVVDQREPMAEETAGVAAGHRAELVVGERAPGRGQARVGCRARTSRRAGSRSPP